MEAERAAARSKGFEMPPLDRLVATALPEREHGARFVAGGESERIANWSEGFQPFLDAGLDPGQAGTQGPAMVERVYRELIPDFASRGAEALRERSALHWPEQVHQPLRTLQGSDHWRVPPLDVLLFAQRLQVLRKPCELVVYDGDQHGLPFNGADRDRRTIDRFRRHLRGAARRGAALSVPGAPVAVVSAAARGAPPGSVPRRATPPPGGVHRRPRS